MKTMINCLTFSMIFLCGQLFFGQIQKKKLDENEYDRWYNLVDEKIAPNGNWISFRLKYNSRIDTLVLKNTKNRQTFYLSKGTNAIFSPDSNWFVYTQNQNVLIVHQVKKKVLSNRFSRQHLASKNFQK